MGNIIRFNDYQINEGIRDKMTPKSEDDVKKSIDRFMEDLDNKTAKEIIEKLSNNKVLQYLDKDNRDKLVKSILSNKEIVEDEFTFDFDNFITCTNTQGNGRIIINLQNNKIYEVGLFAAKEVIMALKQLL